MVALADTIASHKRQERDQLLQAFNFMVELALVRKEAIEAHEKATSKPTDPDPDPAVPGAAPHSTRLLPCDTWAPGYRRRLVSFPSQNWLHNRLSAVTLVDELLILCGSGSIPYNGRMVPLPPMIGESVGWNFFSTFIYVLGNAFRSELTRFRVVRRRSSSMSHMTPMRQSRGPCYIERWKSKFLT